MVQNNRYMEGRGLRDDPNGCSMIEYEIHAGVGHVSPYMEVLKEYLSVYDWEICYLPFLPDRAPKTNERIIHLHRLGRLYDSKDMTSLQNLMAKIDKLKLLGWKFVWTVHNIFAIDSSMTEVDYLAIEEIGKRMDLVFCHTEVMRKSLRDYFGLTVVNHFYGADYHLKKNSESFFVNKNLFNNSLFTFGFIGNLREYKGIRELLNTYERLIKNGKQCNLLIAGSVYSTFLNDNPDIMKKIENNNVFLYDDYVYEEDWAEIVRLVDVLVFPYKVSLPVFKYGFYGSSIAQAAYMKKLIICPDDRNIKSMLSTLNYSFTYDNNDLQGLYDAMNLCMDADKKIHKSYENKLFKLVADKSWNNLAKRINDEYNHLL